MKIEGPARIRGRGEPRNLAPPRTVPTVCACAVRYGRNTKPGLTCAAAAAPTARTLPARRHRGRSSPDRDYTGFKVEGTRPAQGIVTAIGDGWICTRQKYRSGGGLISENFRGLNGMWGSLRIHPPCCTFVFVVNRRFLSPLSGLSAYTPVMDLGGPMMGSKCSADGAGPEQQWKRSL